MWGEWYTALIHEMQKMCPASPTEQGWVLIATLELYAVAVLELTSLEFIAGSLKSQMSKWMVMNVNKVRAAYDGFHFHH